MATETTSAPVIDAHETDPPADQRRTLRSSHHLPRDRRWLIVTPLLIVVLTGGVQWRHQPSLSLALTVGLLLVPGYFLLGALRIESSGVFRLLYTTGGSVVALLAVGLASTLITPHLHFQAAPLATWPIVVFLDAELLIFGLVAFLRAARLLDGLPTGFSRYHLLILLPLAAAAGGEIIENGGSSIVATFALIGAGAALLWGLARASRHQDQQLAWILFVVALTLLLSFSVRSKGLYGFDVQQEFATYQTTAAHLRWSPLPGDSYTACLSISMLPAFFTQVGGITGLAVFKLVFPALFALYPAGIFAFARNWLTPGPAFFGTSLLVFTTSFASQMPALGRQEIGLLLFLGMLLAAFDRSLELTQARLLALILGLGMVLSHYSTTYVALAALVVARLIMLGIQLVHPSPGRPRAVIGPVVLAILVTWCAVWVVLITHSGENVDSFRSDISSQGVQVLPNASGSLVSRWLGGNVTAQASPSEYFEAVEEQYATDRSWLKPYSDGVQADFPAIASNAIVARPVIPQLQPVRYLATLVARQIGTLGATLGTIIVAVAIWRRRFDIEAGALVIAFFAGSLLTRVSGSVSFDYNPERLAMQSAAVLVVPLGLALSVTARTLPSAISVPRPKQLVVSAVALIVFLDASGLGSELGGGSPPGNLATSGEYYERFHATDPDLAASAWIANVRRPDSIIYADRYGALTVQLSENRDVSGILDDLTPGSLDVRAMVFASSSNMGAGRARGVLPGGLAASTYEFPTNFLDTYKAVVFDTGWARVYR